MTKRGTSSTGRGTSCPSKKSRSAHAAERREPITPPTDAKKPLIIPDDWIDVTEEEKGYVIGIGWPGPRPPGR